MFHAFGLFLHLQKSPENLFLKFSKGIERGQSMKSVTAITLHKGFHHL